MSHKPLKVLGILPIHKNFKYVKYFLLLQNEIIKRIFCFTEYIPIITKRLITNAASKITLPTNNYLKSIPDDKSFFFSAKKK